MGSLSHAYLLLYNTVQTLGWAYILYEALMGPLPAVSGKVIEPLYLFQGLAVLEILHSVFGLVRASPVITTIQVYSRLQLIYLHYRCSEVADSSPGLLPMVLAWSITEVVRYSYLGLHMSVGAPGFLKWLRYTLFLVLYPLGVYGEMRVIYDVLPVVDREGILSVAMPNSYNFSFNFAVFLKSLLAIYLPGLYVQYTHMLHQRSKQLGGHAKKSQ
ncbi:ptpla domain protein, putative [Perkinsus marinus ATCC 50983]|uniref:very-long-chain (3R)-3-hydroxyacyl-CoA dehydratase n=1 Tax=Perkinsus marinus (strain ATCC 50983 / TXsc) TaxID=423536 RepID=C5LQF5_PERM5|nr:ptpla domain protein, putative [Perkinsus marinus ATCC 50983]EER01001.1 ptpla domain protein, putative [Perkinsus marinus ATCC 50983]|eukprot:XP_002768283.1 ptpla domain protein, putative [Perkinsus marinus ATCC 50983]